MSNLSEYFGHLASAVKALEKQAEAIEKASDILAEAAERNSLIHIFGVDARAADIEGELFFRAGGLANIDPIYDPAFSNSHGAYRSELCRPLDGLTPCIMEYYEHIEAGDPILLLAFEPDSTSFAQAARWAREHGLSVLAVLPGLPKDAKTAELLEVSVCFGGAAGSETVCMTAVLDAIMTRAVSKAADAPVWQGSFFPDINTGRDMIEDYLWRVRHL